MTDSIQIEKPGWRAFDSSGAILSGAVLTFFVAGTSTPLTVYSDKGLSVSLGTSVTCDSGGYPTSDGNTKIQIYTGTAAYKVTLKDSSGTTIWSHDNIGGAPDLAGVAAASGRLIGETIEYLFSTAPSTQWLFLNGLTIGSVASNATARASDSADTQTLYTGLWNTYGNTELHIQDSSGSDTTRGASAAADYAANKRLPLPDVCGRARVGADNMGAIASKNRLTGLTNGVNGDTPGAAGGEEAHTILALNIPNLTITITDPGHTHTFTSPTSNDPVSSGSGGGNRADNPVGTVTASNTTGISAAFGTSARGGAQTAANVVQPTIIVPSVIVYAGVP